MADSVETEFRAGLLANREEIFHVLATRMSSMELICEQLSRGTLEKINKRFQISATNWQAGWHNNEP